MKNLLKILLAGFVAFMIFAICQEWAFFSSTWFGGPVETEQVSEVEMQAAEETVALTLSLLRHVYASGGDARFLERLPVSDGVLEELRSDLAYLSRRGLVQEPKLLQLQTLGLTPLGEDRVEVRTREYWSIDFIEARSGEKAESTRSQILLGEYLVVSTGEGWRLEGWDFGRPESGERIESP